MNHRFCGCSSAEPGCLGISWSCFHLSKQVVMTTVLYVETFETDVFQALAGCTSRKGKPQMWEQLEVKERHHFSFLYSSGRLESSHHFTSLPITSHHFTSLRISSHLFTLELVHLVPLVKLKARHVQETLHFWKECEPLEGSPVWGCRFRRRHGHLVRSQDVPRRKTTPCFFCHNCSKLVS